MSPGQGARGAGDGWERRFDVSGADMFHAATDWVGSRISRAVMEAGAARVTVSVEPLEAPEMGDEVRTPDGPGRVRFPTTELDRIAVDVAGDGDELTRHYDLDDLGGYSR